MALDKFNVTDNDVPALVMMPPLVMNAVSCALLNKGFLINNTNNAAHLRLISCS